VLVRQHNMEINGVIAPCAFSSFVNKMTEMSNWSASQVGAWLNFNGFDAYVEPFANDDVDGSLLVQLDEDMLTELGMSSKLQRRKFLIKLKQAMEANLLAVDDTKGEPERGLDSSDQGDETSHASQRGVAGQAQSDPSHPANQDYVSLGDLQDATPVIEATNPTVVAQRRPRQPLPHETQQQQQQRSMPQMSQGESQSQVLLCLFDFILDDDSFYFAVR
jgi:mitogen-activated protein kinase kinase kinase